MANATSGACCSGTEACGQCNEGSISACYGSKTLIVVKIIKIMPSSGATLCCSNGGGGGGGGRRQELVYSLPHTHTQRHNSSARIARPMEQFQHSKPSLARAGSRRPWIDQESLPSSWWQLTGLLRSADVAIKAAIHLLR